MDNNSIVFQSNYLYHEDVYAANPTANGWNDVTVDQEILSYVDELLQQGQVAPPASILETGCGMGNLSIPLARAGFRVMGIDISSTAIQVAIQRASQAESSASFRTANVISLETYQGLEKFDCVLDGLCWHCIIGEDRQAFLGVVRDALQPNGCFLVITMCGNPRSSHLLPLFDPVSRYITSGSIADRYLGQPQDLEEELVAAGFQVVYQRVVEGNNKTGDQDMYLAVAKVSQAYSRR